MGKGMDKIIKRLMSIVKRKAVDWNAFDAVLSEVKDINAFDDVYEGTILTEYIHQSFFFMNGALLPGSVCHFLTCGYDVRANGGRNGYLALKELCWSTYDRYLLDAARILLAAGAPIFCQMEGDDTVDSLFDHLAWKLDGAWTSDGDYEAANIFVAYQAMAKAAHAQKDYTGIGSYLDCVGRPLTAVSMLKTEKTAVTPDEAGVAGFGDALLLWFDDRPLVLSSAIELVVDPLYAQENSALLTDATPAFSGLVGAVLQQVQYLDDAICSLVFDNRLGLLCSDVTAHDKTSCGVYAIRPLQENKALQDLDIASVCGRNSVAFSSGVRRYDEETLALFCDEDAYILSTPLLDPVTKGFERAFALSQCPRTFLYRYTRRYPLQRVRTIACFGKQGRVVALRLQDEKQALYAKVTEDCRFEVWMSDAVYDPLEDADLEDL